MAKLTPELSNQLARARKVAGLTQEQLAVAAEVSRQTIGAIEKGEYNPSTVLALRFAAVLGMTVEQLFWLAEETVGELRGRGVKLGVMAQEEEADADSPVVARP